MDGWSGQAAIRAGRRPVGGIELGEEAPLVVPGEEGPAEVAGDEHGPGERDRARAGRRSDADSGGRPVGGPGHGWRSPTARASRPARACPRPTRIAEGHHGHHPERPPERDRGDLRGLGRVEVGGFEAMGDEDIVPESLVDGTLQVLRVAAREHRVEEQVAGLEERERDQERDGDDGRREHARAGDDEQRQRHHGPGADPLEEPLRVPEQHPPHPGELVGEEAQLHGVGRRGAAGAGLGPGVDEVGVHRARG